MQARFTLAVLLGVVLLAAAACSSSDGLSEAEEEALQEQLEVAEEAREEAERAAREAAREAADAEREAADAKDEADEAAQRADDAEQRADDAEGEITDAQDARRTAEAARQAAARARQAAEERRRAAEERLNQSAEERQSAGFGTSADTLVVTPRRTTDATEVIVSTPDFGSLVVTLVTPWNRATDESSDGTHRDEVVVYTDIEAPDDVPFQDSPYNAGRRVFDAEGEFVASYPISGARTDVSSTGGALFPSTSAPPKTFNLVDRGYDTEAQQTAAMTSCDADPDCNTSDLPPLRNKVTHPLRYSVDVTGETLGMRREFSDVNRPAPTRLARFRIAEGISSSSRDRGGSRRDRR